VFWAAPLAVQSPSSSSAAILRSTHGASPACLVASNQGRRPARATLGRCQLLQPCQLAAEQIAAAGMVLPDLNCSPPEEGNAPPEENNTMIKMQIQVYSQQQFILSKNE